MSLLQSQLSTLVAQERVLDEELRRLAMQHYRALAGRSATRGSSSLATAPLEAANASCNGLSSCDSEYFSSLLRRLSHLRAAAASSAATASAVTPGVASGSSPAAAAGMAALDLLELPSLMETCVRNAIFNCGGTGMWGSSSSLVSALATSGDDAVDLVEFACNIFASQRLLEAATAALRATYNRSDNISSFPNPVVASCAPSVATGAETTASQASGGRSPPVVVASSLLVHIIREVLNLAQELQSGLTHSLGARAPLPVVLKAISLLRRLARLQRKAVEKSVAQGYETSGSQVIFNKDSESLEGGEALDSPHITAWLRWLFMAERDAMMAKELDSAAGDATGLSTATSVHGSTVTTVAAASSTLSSSSNPEQQQQKTLATRQPPLLRILELHRTLCSELISQYSAVNSSLTPRSLGIPSHAPSSSSSSSSSPFTTLSYAAADSHSRCLLVEAVNWRCNSMLAQSAEALTRLPEAAVSNAQQPMAYAARRSGRFGVDYSAPLSVAWGANILDSIGGRLLIARRILAGADVKDERGSLALLSASLRASIEVFNSLRNAMPKSLEKEIIGEFLAHFHALADSSVLSEWPSCAGVFSEATQPLLDALVKFLGAMQQ